MQTDRLARDHSGLTMHGALAALAFKPEGLPRRQRASVGEIAECSATRVLSSLHREIVALNRRAEHMRNPHRAIAAKIRALRLEQLSARYGRGRIEDRIREALRHQDQVREGLFAGAFGPNLIVNTGENFLVDAWQNTVELENMKFHGCGTGTTAAAEGDTALVTESTTALNPDSTRATGSTTEGASANIFRTVGTVSFDAVAAITEWGLFSQAATGGGVLWSRIVFTAINVGNGDSIQFTYDLTVE